MKDLPAFKAIDENIKLNHIQWIFFRLNDQICVCKVINSIEVE